MASSDKRVTYRRLAIPIAIFVLAMILACGSGQIAPSDPILQPPLVNVGVNMDEFLEWIGLFPAGVIPSPWIVEPPTSYFMEQDSFRVQGFAVSSEDRQAVPLSRPIVTLYEVDVAVNPSVVRELDQTEVGDDRKWAIDNVPMESDHMIIAAKVSIVLPGGLRQYSDFSNVIIVHRGKPPAPSIESPEDGFETTEETIVVKGKGQASYSIVLFSNDVEAGKSVADKDLNWQVNNVALNIGDNKLVARIEGCDVESAPVEVCRRISLVWPFGSGEGADYKPDLEMGEISAWFGPNDFHVIYSGGRYCPHTGIDIAVTRKAVHAVAKGTVFKHGWDSHGGGYFITLDHGEWISSYFHLEKEPTLQKGTVVKQGDIIATSGNSGAAGTGYHLHFEVHKWKKDILDGKKEKDKCSGVQDPSCLELININPPRVSRDGVDYVKFYAGRHVDLASYFGECDHWELDWRKVKLNYTLPDDYDKIYCGEERGIAFEHFKHGCTCNQREKCVCEK